MISRPFRGEWIADAPWLAAIVAIALAIRVYRPWPLVFTPTHLNLLENDAWYHLRAIENLVAQFPHRLTVDPYAAPGGMFVPIAPLFDLLVAGAAWIAGLGHPSAGTIGRVAVFAPPVLGAATVVMVYAAARTHAGSLAGLLAAALAAILPGHFLDRTLLGYVDHHALEALLSVAVLWLALRSLGRDTPPIPTAAAMGAVLAAYLLTWTSGAFLLAIVAAWLMLHGVLQSWRRLDVGRAGRMVAGGAAIALVVVVLCRSANPYRFDLQVTSVVAVLLVALALEAGRAAVDNVRAGWLAPRAVAGLAVAGAGVAALVFAAARPALTREILAELTRFRPSMERMQVLEARPLFLYDGTFSWYPSWMMFRSGFAAGLVALVVLAAGWMRSGNARDLLLAIWCGAMYLATLGQNRFGYYLVPVVAIAAGCVSARLVEAGRSAGGWRRNAAVIAVAGLLFGPNLVPAIWTTGRPGGLPAEWLPAFEWLRNHTPEPFGDAAYYNARYDTGAVRDASSSVMVWWDYGYWMIQAAHRVPVTNPTQERAREAGRFFVTTDEREAGVILAAQRARYVFVDELLPFRREAPSTVLGSFESMVIWAGAPTGRFYDAFLVPDGAGYRTVFFYYPDYYRTMTFRLGVLGGSGFAATSDVSVVSWAIREVPALGGSYPVMTNLRNFPTYAAALAHVQELGPGNHRIVGQDPSRPPIPIDPVSGLRLVYRTPAPGVFGHGAVQIFEVAD